MDISDIKGGGVWGHVTYICIHVVGKDDYTRDYPLLHNNCDVIVYTFSVVSSAIFLSAQITAYCIHCLLN